MKLLTLNCHSWQEENQHEKIRKIAETIKEKSYDVIALQEVSQSKAAEKIDHKLKKDNFALVILEELQQLGVTEYQLAWDCSHYGYEIYEEGLAILTKHPIVEEESFFITRSEDPEFWKTRKIVGAKVLIDEEPVTFYSCHLGWWNDEVEPYTEQIDALLKQAGRNDKYFLMGDFNNDAGLKSEGYDYIRGKGLYDTYVLAEKKDEGSTVKGKIAGWSENKRDLRIDYIFSSFPVKVASSSVIFNGTNKPVVSDHFGVEVILD